WDKELGTNYLNRFINEYASLNSLGAVLEFVFEQINQAITHNDNGQKYVAQWLELIEPYTNCQEYQQHILQLSKRCLIEQRFNVLVHLIVSKNLTSLPNSSLVQSLSDKNSRTISMLLLAAFYLKIAFSQTLSLDEYNPVPSLATITGNLSIFSAINVYAKVENNESLLALLDTYKVEALKLINGKTMLSHAASINDVVLFEWALDNNCNPFEVDSQNKNAFELVTQPKLKEILDKWQESRIRYVVAQFKATSLEDLIAQLGKLFTTIRMIAKNDNAPRIIRKIYLSLLIEAYYQKNIINQAMEVKTTQLQHLKRRLINIMQYPEGKLIEEAFKTSHLNTLLTEVEPIPKLADCLVS
ncbi:MAG: hypothetical protein ACK4M7_09600, partial [Burkholderiales bacterium]